MFGVGENERLPAEAYSAAATRKVYATLAGKARRIIAAGHSVIADAVFAAPEERAAIAKIGGPRFHGLFLVADLATRLARVGARSADASDADARVAREQEDYDLGVVEWSKIDASRTPDDALESVRAALTR
jgi:predicted kinase